VTLEAHWPVILCISSAQGFAHFLVNGSKLCILAEWHRGDYGSGSIVSGSRMLISLIILILITWLRGGLEGLRICYSSLLQSLVPGGKTV
jgi:hypothetical protein